ncbi:MAG: hypothetical protein OXF00_07570 [bacterium]|nr:hypothetical protein [bacterium]
MPGYVALKEWLVVRGWIGMDYRRVCRCEQTQFVTRCSTASVTSTVGSYQGCEETSG